VIQQSKPGFRLYQIPAANFTVNCAPQSSAAELRSNLIKTTASLVLRLFSFGIGSGKIYSRHLLQSKENGAIVKAISKFLMEIRKVYVKLAVKENLNQLSSRKKLSVAEQERQEKMHGSRPASSMPIVEDSASASIKEGVPDLRRSA